MGMPEPEWKADLRRQLETVGEAQVRAELGDLSLGGEERRLFIAGWLDEKEKARKRLGYPRDSGGHPSISLVADSPIPLAGFRGLSVR